LTVRSSPRLRLGHRADVGGGVSSASRSGASIAASAACASAASTRIASISPSVTS